MRKLFMVCLIGCALSARSFAAEESKAKQEIGEWWNQSALSYDPMLEQWLFHVEATVSYQKLSGNTKGTIYSASPMITIRKGRFSNYLGYSLTAQDVVYSPESSVDTRTESITEDLRCEITKWFFVAGGYRNLKDDLTYIDNRDTYFGGVGVSWSPVKDRLTMGMFVAYGEEETAYLPALGVPDEDSGGVYVQPTVQWQILETVSFSGKGTYLEYFEDEMGKRWNVDLGLDVVLAPHLFLNLSWNKTYENNIAIRSNPDAENTTTTQMVGLKLSY